MNNYLSVQVGSIHILWWVSVNWMITIIFFSFFFFSERIVTIGVSLQNLMVLCALVILPGQAGAVEVRVQLHHGTSL